MSIAIRWMRVKAEVCVVHFKKRVVQDASMIFFLKMHRIVSNINSSFCAMLSISLLLAVYLSLKIFSEKFLLHDLKKFFASVWKKFCMQL